MKINVTLALLMTGYNIIQDLYNTQREIIFQTWTFSKRDRFGTGTPAYVSTLEIRGVCLIESQVNYTKLLLERHGSTLGV